jgi:hypothetical protein
LTGASRATALEQMATRVDRLVSIAESAIPVAATAPHPDGYDWYLPWSERLTSLRTDAQALIKPTTASPQIIADTSNTADEQLKKASQRVDAWIEQCDTVLAGPEVETAAEAAAVEAPSAELTSALQGMGEWIYCVADGGADHLTIEFLPTGVTPLQTRAGLLLAIVGLAFATIWAVRQPAARDLFWRWPQAVGVLVGLAYWAWLWPSGLGLLIVTVSLLMLFHRNVAGRSMRAEGTTVLRLRNRS